MLLQALPGKLGLVVLEPPVVVVRLVRCRSEGTPCEVRRRRRCWLRHIDSISGRVEGSFCIQRCMCWCN